MRFIMKTQTYVSVASWENGADYSAARWGGIDPDRIDGSYEHLYSFRPLGRLDCTFSRMMMVLGYFISLPIIMLTSIFTGYRRIIGRSALEKVLY